MRPGDEHPAPESLRGSGARRDDVDGLATALLAELHRTRDEREQRVVAATADAVAGVEVRAALADEDLAGLDGLAAEALDAEVLGVAVATVAGRGRTLLVCHVKKSFVSSGRRRSGVDRGDLDLGERLAVAL